MSVMFGDFGDGLTGVFQSHHEDRQDVDLSGPQELAKKQPVSPVPVPGILRHLLMRADPNPSLPRASGVKKVV
jgi:hypothetical protein